MTLISMRRENALDAHQRGISLVVVMVLLVAVSLLGIAVLRSSAMQERMSANLRDRNLAFQSAEAALRYAQEDVLGGLADLDDEDRTWDNWTPNTSSCENRGICPTGAVAAWQSLPHGEYESVLAVAPEYWIEYLGKVPGDADPDMLCAASEREASAATPNNCESPMYRVFARSRATGRADVALSANIIIRVPDL